jgi:hypothetical protein
MRGVGLRIAIGLPLLLVGGCAADEPAPATSSARSTSGILARAYADPTAGIGFWKVDRTSTGTRIWYGDPTCPWAGS